MRRGLEGPIGQRPQSQGETCAEGGRQSLPGRLGSRCERGEECDTCHEQRAQMDGADKLGRKVVRVREAVGTPWGGDGWLNFIPHWEPVGESLA